MKIYGKTSLVTLMLLLSYCSSHKETPDEKETNSEYELSEAAYDSIENYSNTPDFSSLADTLDSRIKEFRKVENVNPNSERIETKIIDTALQRIEKGDIIVDTNYAEDECNGAELWYREYENGLITRGATYNVHAQNWYISRNFNLLGLHGENTGDDVLGILGEPYRKTKEIYQYLSQIPEGYESGYFDSRWEIFLFFEMDSLKSIAFLPNFDDC